MPAQLYPAEHAGALKAWLTDSLAGICDADPAVLSDYVLALIRHDLAGEELKSFIAEQLEDFLAEGTATFVEQLFSALQTQSYLPAAAAPAAALPVQAQPGAAAGDAGGSRKRRADSPASSSPAPMSGVVSSNKAMRSSDGPSSAPGSAPRERNGRDGRPKEMCRDYHNKGFCSRGDACRYDHSGAVIAGPGPGGMGPAGFPQGPMMGGPMRFGGPPGPQGGFQGMQGMQGMQGQHFGMPPQQQQHGGPWGAGPMPQQGMPHPGAFGDAGPSLGSRMGPQGQQPGFHGGAPHDGQFNGMSGPSRGGHAGGGRGGHNAAPRGSFRGARSQTALVLENVPAEHLELIKINEYFKRFGTITNIQIDAPGQKALVDFARPEEAKAAHGCPDAVFGNRFVRIFFQRLEDAENGGISTPLEKPGAPHQSRPIAKKPAFVPGQTNVYHAPGAPTTAASRAKVELDRKQAQSQLDHLLGEQKTLMASVTSPTITPEARKATMMRLRALPTEIGAATEKVKEAVQAIANLPAAPAPLSTEERNAIKERRERERLDRELEMHGKGDETTDELKAKLESLKAEAASLGLDANGAPSAYRGAPRGRGARGTSFRGGYYNRGGRGGAASMRLDNRTTRLVVSDVPAAQMDATKEYFKTLGDVSDLADSSSAAFIVNYKTRATGETAMRMGGEVPGVGKVKLAWAAVDVPMGGSSPSSGNGSAGAVKEEEADAPMKEEEEHWIP